MSKKKKNRNKIDGSYSVIEHNLANSEAFKDLNIHTKWLYMEFKFRFHGDNRKHITLTYKEAIKFMSINTFIKSRNKLIERGFIDVIERGGLEKQPAIYGLSDRWKGYGTKDFVKVDIKKILPKIYKNKFKKGHKLFKKRKHL
ncbi:hypothetical protein ES703_50542 [subsurface metagenome]